MRETTPRRWTMTSQRGMIPDSDNSLEQPEKPQ